MADKIERIVKKMCYCLSKSKWYSHPAKMIGRTTLRRITFSQYFVMVQTVRMTFHSERERKGNENDKTLSSRI